MKIEYANTIPLREILNKMGLTPLNRRGDTLNYNSPLHPERAPTLKVTVSSNTWFDTSLDQGGDAIDLVCQHLKASGVSHQDGDALRWLSNIMQAPARLGVRFDTPSQAKSCELRAILPLMHPGLIRYLDKRKIDRRYQAEFFREVRVHNQLSCKTFRAVGFRNEDGGYALFNPAMQGQTGPYAVSFIRGSVSKPDTIHIFYSIFDYLSLLAARKGYVLEGDTIILNDYRCLDDAIAYIRHYGYQSCYLWLENTKTGLKAARTLTPVLRTNDHLVVKRMNALYAHFDSLNAWWASRQFKVGYP